MFKAHRISVTKRHRAKSLKFKYQSVQPFCDDAINRHRIHVSKTGIQSNIGGLSCTCRTRSKLIVPMTKFGSGYVDDEGMKPCCTLTHKLLSQKGKATVYGSPCKRVMNKKLTSRPMGIYIRTKSTSNISAISLLLGLLKGAERSLVVMINGLCSHAIHELVTTSATSALL